MMATCLSGVTASAFILKVRDKENHQEPDTSIALRKSALRWHTIWRYLKYTLSSGAAQQVLVHLQTTLEAMWPSTSSQCFKKQLLGRREITGLDKAQIRLGKPSTQKAASQFLWLSAQVCVLHTVYKSCTRWPSHRDSF